MAEIYSFKIAGQNFNPFIDWTDSEVIASKDDGGTQLNIVLKDVIFTNKAAKYIRDYIAGGVTGVTKGYYEGPKFEMVIQNPNNTLTTFKGCLDFKTGYKEISPVKVQVALRRLQDKLTVKDRSKVITMLLLQEEGIITPNDYVNIPYVVEKKFNGLEFVLLGITTYLMLKELAEAVTRLAKDLADIAAHISGGATGPAAALVFSVVSAAINLAYSILIVLYIIDLVGDMIEYLISPVRDWKGMKFRTMLEKGAQYMGYQYESSPTLLDDLYILPSKNAPAPLSQQFLNQVTGQGVPGVPDDGIPNSVDIGHTLEECFQLHADLFRSKMKIDEDNDIIYQEPLVNDTFWSVNSNFILPDTLNETKIYNGDDIKARILIRFEYDDKDDWTLQDQLGRIYEIVTHPVSIGDPKCVNLGGLKEVRPGLALGSRKPGLTPIENALKTFATIADGAVNFLGGNSNLAAKITNRVGMLRVSENETAVAKLLYMRPGSGGLVIPQNHKDFLSSKALWENFHVEDSWVLTVGNFPNRGQKRLLSDDPITIPLGFEQALSIVANTKIADVNGNEINIDDLRWKFSLQKAKINGWLREPYTTNLQHTYYDSDDPNL